MKYLDPKVFRRFTTKDMERSVNRALPKFAEVLNVTDPAQMLALKTTLLRYILPQVTEEILALANEKDTESENS